MGRILVIVGICLCIASVVAAENPSCAQRDDVVGDLSRTYEEMPRGLGVTGSGGVIEVLTSPSGDTWSIIVTWPNGRSCLVAAGESWQNLDAPGHEDAECSL